MNTDWSIAQESRLSGAEALWVYAAHAWALLLPLALVWVVAANQPYLATVCDYPWLFYVAAGVMMAGSAFEIAQNSIDRWYIEPGTASADGKSLCDMLFFWMIVMSQALVITACFGAWWWLTAAVWLPALLYPLFYSRDKLAIAPLALLGTGSAAAAWFSFGDPLIVLQLIVSPLVASVFAALLHTGDQRLHGVTTLVASSNALILTAAILSAADGEPSSWWLTAAAAAVMLALTAVFRRLSAA